MNNPWLSGGALWLEGLVIWVVVGLVAARWVAGLAGREK